MDEELNGPITQAEIDANADWGGITCYACEVLITEPGGEWIQSRPYTAYPYCPQCVRGDEQEGT